MIVLMIRPIARLLALGTVALALAGCQSDSGGPAASERPKPAAPARSVRVAPALEERQARVVSATGTLAADDQAVLGTKVPGRLAEISVDLGSRVGRGEPIARLDPSDFKLRVEQAEAALHQARVRLGLAATGDDDRVDVEQMAIVRQARAVLEEAQLTRDRFTALFQQQFIARAQLDSAVAAHQVAEGRYHDALEEGRNRQAVVAQRRSELALARQQLSDTVILSPVDGAVSQRQASVGEYLAAGAAVATVVRLDPLRLRVSVPERESTDVRIGQVVRLGVEGDLATYTGKVVRLSPIVQEQNRTLLVEAEVPNNRGALRPGAFARVDIVTETAQPVVLVPVSAIIVFAGVEKVMLVREGKTVEQRVVTGRRQGNRVEVVEGLKGGQPVVQEPGNLTGGQSVAIAP
jgi:RND family efflux transporter MFP subunit